jgi:thiol-disulfide isomerase/thioredoxin
MSSGRIRDSKPPAGESGLRTGKPGVLRRKTAGYTGCLVLGAAMAVLLVACGPTTSADLVADFPITVYTGADALGGTELNFSDLRGQPIILNFWAGLCPPCRAEMPDLQQFYDEYQERTVMIGVDVGQFTGLGNQADARALLEALEITYPTGFTGKGTILQDYGVISMPTTLFITSEGQVFRKWAGVLNIENLAKITNEMLSQEPG